MAQQTIVQELVAGCSADPKSEKCEDEVFALVGAAIGHINFGRSKDYGKEVLIVELADKPNHFIVASDNAYTLQGAMKPLSGIAGADLITTFKLAMSKAQITVFDKEVGRAAKELVQGVIR